MSKGQTAGVRDVPQLHACPFCSQGFRRQASLKEHGTNRHENCDEDWNIDEDWSYDERHESHHLHLHHLHHRGNATTDWTRPKRSEQRLRRSCWAVRRYSCNICLKAFKHNHHLKEHLRIHTGERPFECGNCKKRFTHSGSYSGHITGTKCSPFYFPNGLDQRPLSAREAAARSAQLANDPKPGRSLKEQILLTQIKTEPMEVSAVKGVKQSRGKEGFLFQQPRKQIVNLPAFVDNDGNTKIMINYIRSPTSFPIIAALPISSRTKQITETEDSLNVSSVVKAEQDSIPISNDLGIVISKTESVVEMPEFNGCLLCEEECPEHLEAVHLLQHRKAANGEAVDSDALDPSFAALLSEAGVTVPHSEWRRADEDALSMLKSAFASNTQPGLTELREISDSVGVPSEVVRKWFVKMNRKAGKETSKLVKVIPKEDCVKYKDIPTQKAVNEKTQDFEKQRSHVSPVILRLRKFINTRLERKPQMQEESNLPQETLDSPDATELQVAQLQEKKPEFQKDILEFQEKILECSEDILQFQEQMSDFQNTLKNQDDLELHNDSKLSLGSITLLSSNDKRNMMLVNLEWHNYSKRSTNSELQQFPESHSISTTCSLSNKDPEVSLQTERNLANLELHNYSKSSEDFKLQEMPKSQTTSTPTLCSDKNLDIVVKTEREDFDMPKSTSSGQTLSPVENMGTREETTPLENVLVQRHVLQTVFQKSDARLEYRAVSKEQPEPRALYVTAQSSDWTETAQIPTLVAVVGHSAFGCFSAFNPTTKKTTILTPQLQYNYKEQVRDRSNVETARNASPTPAPTAATSLAPSVRPSTSPTDSISDL